MSSIGKMTMPDGFRYKEVFMRGKPQHDCDDAFGRKHPRMNIGHRAKIFSPFDALKGFDDAIASRDIPYGPKKEPGQKEAEELDRRLRILSDLTRTGKAARENGVKVSATYFIPCADENHEAYGLYGQYHTVTGVCMGVDAEVHKTIRIDGYIIGFEDLLSIENHDGIFENTNGYQDV